RARPVRRPLHKYTLCGIIDNGGSLHLRTFLHCETDDGMSLPVIDVPHPAFALAMTDAEIASMSERFVDESAQRQEMPPPVRQALERSMLGRALMAASGTFLTGMNTYVLKLGPGNLGGDVSP